MQLFKELKWYFKKEIKRYLIAIILLILISILQIFPPKIIGILIDSILKQEISKTQTLPLIILILAIATTIYILRYLWRIFLFGAAYKLTIKLRIKIYDYLSQQNQIFFSKNRTGDLMTKISNDVDKVAFAAGEGVLTLVDSLVMGLSVLTVMIVQIDWKLTLISLIPMPIMAIIIRKFGQKLHYNFKKSQIAFSNLNSHTQESLSNISMIKAFGLEEYHKNKFFKISKKLGQKNITVSKINAKFDPVIHISISLSHLLAITFGSKMILNHQITIGQLTSFIMYLGLMIWPMLALAWMFNIIERGNASWNRIKLIIINNSPIKKINHRKIPKHLKKLQVNINTFYYVKNTKKILTNIKFTLNPGQILGICGPTGSGKSTLIKIIQRQLELTDGTILYNSIPISKFNIIDWRKKLAIVDQTTFLFSDTILNNIILGQSKASKQDIETVSYLANLHNDIKKFPKGYDTQVGEKGILLSGGQKQRISIARALLLKSEILILDNALSAVDNNTEQTILNNFFYKYKNQTTSIIMCTHRLLSLNNADLIIVIKNGTIIQSGTHINLIKKKKTWYSNTYNFQKILQQNNHQKY